MVQVVAGQNPIKGWEFRAHLRPKIQPKVSRQSMTFEMFGSMRLSIDSKCDTFKPGQRSGGLAIGQKRSSNKLRLAAA